MSAKRHTKTANINACIYEGDSDVSFDCVGVLACKFALCHTMPPTGDDECCCRDQGTCLSVSAKIEALRCLTLKIKGWMKQLEEDLEY